MKLPGRRKIIKIRQTVYEDPGNPFQDELDAERRGNEEVSDLNKPLPDAPDEVSPTGRSFFELDISLQPCRNGSECGSEAGRRLSPDRSLPYEPREESPTARSFRFDSVDDDGSNYAPDSESIAQAPQSSLKEYTPPVRTRREHHRSMSLAIPVSPRLGSEEYVSPRRFWQRKSSLPLIREAAEEKKDAAASMSTRDTKFYGFYEDLMRDYGKRGSQLQIEP